MEKKLNQIKEAILPSKGAGKRTLDAFASEVVTNQSKNRLQSSNLLQSVLMNKKIYIGIASFAVLLIIVMAFLNSNGLQERSARFGGEPKTQYAIATEEVDAVASDVDETIAEMEKLDSELEELEASISFDEIDALMKDIESISY